MYGPMMFFGFLIPLVVVALVVYGVWELARSRDVGIAAQGAVAGSASARSILDERFARGDLDAEEYVQRRALLDGTLPSPPPGTVSGSHGADAGVVTSGEMVDAAGGAGSDPGETGPVD